MSNFSVQFARNNPEVLVGSKEAAVNLLNEQELMLDGEPVVIRYWKNPEQTDHGAILGVSHNKGTKAHFSYIDLDNGVKLEELDTAIKALQNYNNNFKLTSTNNTININGLNIEVKTGKTLTVGADGTIDVNVGNTLKVDNESGKINVNIDGETIQTNESGELTVASSALTQYVGSDAIEVGAITSENEKTISLKLATANQILSTVDGLNATLSLVFIKGSDNTQEGDLNGKPVIQLLGKDGDIVSQFDATDLVMDGVLDEVKLDGSKLTFTWSAAANKTATEIDLSDYIKAYSAGNGIKLDNQTFSVKIKEGENYLEVDEEGLATKDIDDAISDAVADKVKQIKVNGVNSDKVTAENEGVVSVEITGSDIDWIDTLPEGSSEQSILSIAAKIQVIENALKTAKTELSDAIEKLPGNGLTMLDGVLSVNISDAPIEVKEDAIVWSNIKNGKYVIDCGTFGETKSPENNNNEGE